jgi:hypothetical protein
MQLLRFIGAVFFFHVCAAVSFAGNKMPIKIFCHVQNQVDSAVRFSYFSGMLKPTETELTKNIYNKEVSFLVESDKPMSIRVEHDFRYFELFCEPGDSIVMDFNAEIYPTEITFSGQGALHNSLLHQYRQQFIPLSNKVVIRKINTSSGLEFRKFMDKNYTEKWKVYHAFPEAERTKCSENFKKFISAEIEYWYAYYLMRYRDEHLSLVMDESLYLPDAYFDFLNEVQLNNDEAFLHPNYLKFIKLYYEFRKSNPDFPHGLAARQIFAKPKEKDITLYESMDCKKEVSKIEAYQKLLILDKSSFSNNSKNKPVAYRLKVKTEDGYAVCAIE